METLNKENNYPEMSKDIKDGEISDFGEVIMDVNETFKYSLLYNNKLSSIFNTDNPPYDDSGNLHEFLGIAKNNKNENLIILSHSINVAVDKDYNYTYSLKISDEIMEDVKKWINEEVEIKKEIELEYKMESKEKTINNITMLSEEHLITRDQERIASEAMKSETFALLSNRIMNQGSDPESIRLIEVEAFRKVAEKLGLNEKQAIDAIQIAHKFGPAALKDKSSEEELWLLTASISADESDKKELSDRLKQFVYAIDEIRGMSEKSTDELKNIANEYRNYILSTITPIGKTESGIPIYNDDLGFFSAYRSGHKAAIVDAGDYSAVGTTPDTTLEKEGISVDKKLSDQFGLIFKN